MYLTPYLGTFADTYQHLSRHLLASGIERGPRGLGTIDSGEPVFFTIDDDGLFRGEIHSTHHRYLCAELLWYLSRDMSVDFIGKHASLWTRIADDDGLINSNYGYHMLGDEIAFAFRQLQSDPHTRKAVISVHGKEHHRAPTNDLPCTMHMQFQTSYDEDGSYLLNATVVMRSSDIHFGLPFDVPWFRFLQKQLRHLLNAYTNDVWTLGKLSVMTHSLHMYEKDISKHSAMVHTDLSAIYTPSPELYLTPSGGLTLPTKPDAFIAWLLNHADDGRAPLPHPFHKYGGAL